MSPPARRSEPISAPAASPTAAAAQPAAGRQPAAAGPIACGRQGVAGPAAGRRTGNGRTQGRLACPPLRGQGDSPVPGPSDASGAPVCPAHRRPPARTPHLRAAGVETGALTVLLALIVLLIGAIPAAAQTLSLDLGDDASMATRAIQLLVLVTVLSLVPGLAVMVTCFPFLVTVFAILRQAVGLMASPPNMLLVSLALFLTYFVMEPVFVAAWSEGVGPLLDGRLEIEPALVATLAPFREFMAARIDPGTFEALAELRPDLQGETLAPDAALSVLIPSFMLSEIARAFEIGFLIFLPFLIIDLVVAAVLMSMGMMMVPPAIVSLPFKLAFFVVADGWTLIASALVRSYT